jgi:2-polyprenyl-3-methyl-5-hydroxy-6-metoxy-1,4-benzoquinol methylase
MTIEKRDFNKEAARWDENPGRVKMAEDVFDAIKRNVKLNRNMDVMDFGCGTGLLSLHLLPHVNTVTGTDSSEGMLDVFRLKITDKGLTGIKAIHVDLDKGDRLSGIYDIVTSSMTMHHIKDVAPLIVQFYDTIKPAGYLCIADLDPDKGMFHESNEGVFHKGFHRDEMKRLFSRASFINIFDVTVTEIVKPDKNGSVNSFSIFLVIGEKNKFISAE